MANTPRPPKARGNRNYHDEVLAGKPDILDVEVDDDFDTIYKTVNGQLIDENIQAGANINWSKINHAGQILVGDLNAAFKLPHANLADNAVQTNNILDGTILKTDISPGQTLFNPPQLAENFGVPILVAPFGNQFLAGTTYGARSYVYCQAFVCGQAFNTGAGHASGTLHVSIYANPGALQLASTPYAIDISPATQIAFAIPAFGQLIPPAGAVTYSITFSADLGSGSFDVAIGYNKLQLIEPS